MRDIDPQEPEKAEMSFLDHLDQLRMHILRSLLAVAVIAIGVFMAKDFVFNVVIFGPRPDFFGRSFLLATNVLAFAPSGKTSQRPPTPLGVSVPR